jgi:hypothetical protein
VLESVDTGALPMTEPHPAPFFDTGPHPEPLVSYDADEFDFTPPADSVPFRRIADADVHVDLSSAVTSEPLPKPAHPIAVPGQFQFVRRWKFALLLAGVWIAAEAIGAGLYYWWFQSIDKTWPDACVLLYVIVCVVAALLVSMTETRPMLSALAVGLMVAPFASACGAALLYGAYAFGWLPP